MPPTPPCYARRRTRGLPRAALATLAASAVAAAAVASAGRPDANRDAGATGTVVEVSTSHCGAGWTSARAGRQVLTLRNTGTVVAGAALVDVTTGAVYGEVEVLAPGTDRPLPATLVPGRYALRCLPDASDALTGPVVRVAGPTGPTGTTVHAGPAVLPVTVDDLLGPVRTYRAHVATGLTDLVTRTDALAVAVRSGDRAAARTAWLPAHLAYERLGAAYDTFGDFADLVDGRPDGLPGGVRDPRFTGFHRVEYGLWHGEGTATLTAATDTLDRDVRALRAAFARQETDPDDLGLRAHEILENTVTFELSGRADQGSGTMLATASANLEGTTAVLSVLRPLLRTRYPGLSGVDQWLARVRAAVAAAHGPGDRWTPVGRLRPADRTRLDAAFGELLERLAPVAVICEARRTS